MTTLVIWRWFTSRTNGNLGYMVYIYGIYGHSNNPDHNYVLTFKVHIDIYPYLFLAWWPDNNKVLYKLSYIPGYHYNYEPHKSYCSIWNLICNKQFFLYSIFTWNRTCPSIISLPVTHIAYDTQFMWQYQSSNLFCNQLDTMYKQYLK